MQDIADTTPPESADMSRLMEAVHQELDEGTPAEQIEDKVREAIARYRRVQRTCPVMPGSGLDREDKLKMPIAILEFYGLSTRILSCLDRNLSIGTVGELLVLQPCVVLTCPNMGQESLECVKRALLVFLGADSGDDGTKSSKTEWKGWVGKQRIVRKRVMAKVRGRGKGR